MFNRYRLPKPHFKITWTRSTQRNFTVILSNFWACSCRPIHKRLLLCSVFYMVRLGNINKKNVKNVKKWQNYKKNVKKTFFYIYMPLKATCTLLTFKRLCLFAVLLILLTWSGRWVRPPTSTGLPFHNYQAPWRHAWWRHRGSEDPGLTVG